MHTPHNSQSIIYEWPMSKFLKKHIPKWKIELKENKEGKYRAWKDKKEIKKTPDNWFQDSYTNHHRKVFAIKNPKPLVFTLHIL